MEILLKHWKITLQNDFNEFLMKFVTLPSYPGLFVGPEDKHFLNITIFGNKLGE